MTLMGRHIAVRRGGNEFLVAAGMLAVLLVGRSLVLDGVLTWTDLAVVLAVSLLTFGPVLGVEEFIGDLEQAFAGARRIWEITDAPPVVTDPAQPLDVDVRRDVEPAIALPLQRDGSPAVRVLPAAEYGGYTAASQAAFWDQAWKITPQSDRYGYRLAGEALQAIAPMEMRSHGIVPGVIQVPPDGQPIVQMRDAQPSGGYPKIGTVIEADLWRLGQAPVGSRVRFIECDWDAALAALAETRRWLDEARRLVDLQRLQHSKR